MTAVIINFAAWRAARAAATTATPPEPFATPRFWPPRISHPDPKTILIKDTVPQTAIDTSMNGASTLAVNLMHKLALVTLGDLTTVSMEWLLDQPRVGHGTVSRARWALHAYGLEFQGVPVSPARESRP